MGQINDSFALTFRDFTNAGLPASGFHDPDKRDIRSIAPLIEAGIAAAAIAGGDLDEAEALIQPLLDSALAAQVAAENAAGLAADAVLGVPKQIHDAIAEILALAADQPAFAALVIASMEKRDRIEARGLLYGLANSRDRELFAAEGTELAFADNLYRSGYAIKALTDLPGWEPNGITPIDGRGLYVTGTSAPALLRPNQSDVTLVVEVDMPEGDGSTKFLANYTGDSTSKAIGIYRNSGNQYQVQIITPGEATRFAFGPIDASARRMRVALSIGATETRVSFGGANPLTIAARRPVDLLRLWFGREALGFGVALEGFITRSIILPYSVSNQLLKQLAGEPVTEDDVNQLIDSRIMTHDNDRAAHDLAPLRQQADLSDSKTGIWTVRAADSFSGSDGSPLGSTEVGGLPWVSPAGLVRKGGRARHPSDGYGGAWINAGNSDGQVEADLYPGTSEASLYARLNAATTQWILLQRSFDGAITLNLQFGGQTTRLAPPVYRVVEDGERYKLRFIGPRIWVLRLLNGVEELLFDVTETRLSTEKIHGLRLNGGGSVDNFRVLQREAI